MWKTYNNYTEIKNYLINIFFSELFNLAHFLVIQLTHCLQIKHINKLVSKVFGTGNLKHLFSYAVSVKPKFTLNFKAM